MKKSEVKQIIRKTLGIDESLDESYVAQPKVYDLNTEMLLSKTKDAHKELYQGYIEKFNRLSAELDVADKMAADCDHSEYRNVKVNEQTTMNAVYLHELYFANISDPYSEIGMDSFAHMRLNRDFNSFDEWQKDFIACALSSRNGWVVTVLSTYLKSYVNIVIDGHDGHIPIGTYPVIVLDMWEHARRDYLNNKQDYVVAMMKELNWNVIEERFKRSDLIIQATSGEGQGWQ